MVCKSILIVEDDDSIRNTLELALQLEGYSVYTAANGEEGLDVLPKMPTPCLILLDLMMPVMDGWAFADALRKDMVLGTIPIVVVTAFEDKAKTIGKVSGVIKKPVGLDFLFETVRRHCNPVETL